MNDYDYIPEKDLPKSSKSLSLEEMFTSIKQMENSILKIKCNSDSGAGTGFYCLIEAKDWTSFPLRVLMTNNHVLGENSIKNGEIIKYSLNNNKINMQITIDESRITYTNKKYDITIIEIKEKDGINKDSFLEIDNQIFNNNPNECFRDKAVYLLHYPKGYEIKRADGLIKFIKESNIEHYINSEKGSSGAPILNLKNSKVIGIHKGAAKEGQNWNVGTLLKGPIEELRNIIKIKKQNIINKIDENIQKIDKQVNIKRKINENINNLDDSNNIKSINENKNIKDKKLEKKDNNELKIKEIEKEKEKENLISILKYDKELEEIYWKKQKKREEFEYEVKKKEQEYKSQIELKKKTI